MTDIKRKIGGSMIAKILKKSKWGTPLDAWLELTGKRPPDEKTGEDIDRGNFLEPALREWANKKTGLQFFKPTPGVAVLPSWSWATVSPDGISANPLGPNHLLEIKAPRRDDALEWGEEGTDEVPMDALLQTHWGMMVTNADAGVVASLVGGECRIYRVKRDRELEAKMLDRAMEFVEHHVLTDIPPPAEFGDRENILYLHPRNVLGYRHWPELTKEEQRAVSFYLDAYKVADDAKKAMERCAPSVQELIGDCEGIDQLPPELGKRIDFKCNESGGTKWKDVARDLGQHLSEEEFAKLAEQYPGKVPRVFRPWFVKEGKKP